MAIVTTISGTQIDINPINIAVVADDPQTGTADVFGATHGMLQLNEPTSGLLVRLGITGNFAQLTRPDGTPVWIAGKAASSVRAPLPSEYPASAHAVVTTAPVTQAVEEDVASTVAVLNAHGGNL